jgi:flagellar M-ring protein FliF
MNLRRAGLMLGVVVALGLAIWQFPGRLPASSAAAASSAAVGSPAGSTAVDSLSASAQSTLDQVLGPHRSVITASATYSQPTTKLATTYNPKGVAVLNQSGVSSPGYTASVTSNGVSRSVTRSSSAGGQIQRLSVAVVVDSTLRPAPALATIRRTVSAAMGLQVSRGDKITVVALPMAAAVAASNPPLSLAGRVSPYLPSGLAIAAAIALLLFRFLPRRRRQRR